MSTNTFLKSDFIRYTSQNILGQMAYSCYTVADTFFIAASLGANGLTALNLAFPAFCLLNGTGLMIGMGGGINYAIAQGQKKALKANSIFTNAFYTVLLFSAIFLIAGLFFSETLAILLGSDAAVFDMTHTYLKVLLLFSPAFLLNNLLHCFIRNDRNPSLSMIAMIIGSLANIILDYIFIFPMQMGILGAILATGLAPIISITILSAHFLQKKNNFTLQLNIPDYKKITAIISNGLPPFVTELSSGIVMFLFNYMILGITGNIGVAAFSIITVISLVVVAIFTGLSQGIQPLFSLSYGQGSTSGVKSILYYSLGTVLFLSCVIYTTIYLGAEQLAAIFNSESNTVLQNMAVNGMHLYFLACPFIGFNIVIATYFTSTEWSRPAQLITIMRGLIVLVPITYLLSYLLQMQGVWCAYPVTEAIVAAIGCVFFALTNKFK